MKVLVVILSSLSVALAFTTPGTRGFLTNYNQLRSSNQKIVTTGQNHYGHPLSMASGDSDGSKKRRKRKDGKQFAPSANNDPATVATKDVVVEPSPLVEPKQNTVVMQVRDIRSVVSGDDFETNVEVDNELGPDEEWEYYDDDEEDVQAKAAVSSNDARMQDDSMEQLLADARKMRASTTKPVEEKEKSMSDTFFEVISTIVTIDFFVVIGLLVWFLAGIFCSSVLGNDAVQIAFNMNFERVTQPALGILMIGSVAGGEF
jgi:hypothetical protein